tara:strand:- start:350 stop:907 length:558 start_codon:yes stop_codon:yes gene_type:complete
MIRAILFDYYGVLRPDTYQQWLDAHGLIRTGVFQTLSEKVDANIISTEDFFESLSTLTDIDSETIRNEFSNTPLVDDSVHALLSKLKASYSLGLISNGSIRTRDRLNTDKLASYFDAIIISAEVGKIKPDPAIYYAALTQLNASVEEVIYIDDSATNIEAAQKLGFISIHFTDIKKLDSELSRIL